MPEPTLVVRGGTVVGPAGLTRADVAIAGSEIVAVAESIDVSPGVPVLDAGGCLVGPGLVDLHTHLRQPGREEAETIETGARAAALGGFTAVVAMPNTEPPIDSADHAEDFAHRWRDKLAEYCTIRMQELGIPDDMNGQPDYDSDGKWHAFDPRGRKGGGNTTGVVIDSGVLNPELLKGKKGGRIWPGMRLRDRIDLAEAFLR